MPLEDRASWLVVGTILLIAALLRVILPFEGAFITFYPAVVFAALVGGWRGGTAVLLASLTIAPFYIEPVGTYELPKSGLMSMFAFVGFSVAMILAVALQQRAMSDARKMAEDLAANQRFTDAVIEAAPSLTYLYDLEKRQSVFISRQCEDVLGYTQAEIRAMGSEALGRLLHPDDLSAATERFERVMASRADELFELEYRMLRKDGGWVWLLSRDRVFKRLPDGATVQILGVATDITERKRTEDSLAASEERFRGIFENAPTGISISDMAGHFEHCNPAYERMFGYSEHDLQKMSFVNIVHPGDRAANLAEMEKLVRGQVPFFEIFNRFVHRDGHVVWVHKFVTIVRDRAGRPTHLVALVTDMTERKKSEEQIRLLMREVNHRSKNLLAVVQSVARQTASYGDPATFAQRFSERLQGLSASHDLLVHNSWRGVELHDLVESQLAHFADLVGKRITLEGPLLRVNAVTAQSLGMALHELATNAGKYGALSNDEGRVRISWALEEDGTEPGFSISWVETGGPLVDTMGRKGLGSLILSSLAEQALSGKVENALRPEGLMWRLEAPAERVMEAPEARLP